MPALAARAPGGETYVATGTGEARIARMMSRIDVSRPPGVSISITTNALPRSAALCDAALDVVARRRADRVVDGEQRGGAGGGRAGGPIGFLRGERRGKARCQRDERQQT